MTARVLLIRHAAHGQLGSVLSGRSPDLPLTQEGCSQAARLVTRLADQRIGLLHCSPVQRARETGQAIAAAQPGLSLEQQAALDEIDFGRWAGRPFAELVCDPSWTSWNTQRATAVAPGGESMAGAQQRAWTHVVHTALNHPGSTIAMVTHCDIIRSLVAQVLGLSLDRLLTFDIAPASVSRLEIGEWGARVLSVNEFADA